MEEVSRSYSLSAEEVELIGLRAAEFSGNKKLIRFMNEALHIAKSNGGIILENKLIDSVINLADESLLGASGAITVPAEIALQKMKVVRQAP